MREPFIVRWKGKTPANRVDTETVFGGADWLPTVSELARVEPPTEIQGEDLSDSFEGRSVERTRPLMWENRFPVYGHVLDKSPMLAIRDGRWKLLMNPGSQPRGTLRHPERSIGDEQSGWITARGRGETFRSSVGLAADASTRPGGSGCRQK